MTPAEFADVVVLPTVRDHLANRGDRRLAYLACIVTFALVEYIGAAESIDVPQKQAVKDATRLAAPTAYGVVRGVCNGTKHAGVGGTGAYLPGTEQYVPRPFFGHAYYGHFRLGTDGLKVEHEGQRFYIDHCIQWLLRVVVSLYPQHLGTLDLAFLDPPFRPQTEAPTPLASP